MNKNSRQPRGTEDVAKPSGSKPKAQSEKSPPALSVYLGPEAASEHRMKALDHLTDRLGLRGRSTLIQWIADGRLWVVAPPVPYVEEEWRRVALDEIESKLDAFVENLRSRRSRLDVTTMILEMLQSVPNSARDQLIEGARDRVEALKRLERAESKLREVVEQMAVHRLDRLPAEGLRYDGNKKKLERGAAEIQAVIREYVGPKISLPEESISIEVDLAGSDRRPRPDMLGAQIQPYWRNLLSVGPPGKFTGFYTVERFGREIADLLAEALGQDAPSENKQ